MIHYKSLEDFLISKELSVDAELDDGLGAKYPVKGREIEATILFADISLFSKRTLDLAPTATLIFVNRFFTWITNEALKGLPCIIDKYIGDQIMIIFSKEFGSKNPFIEAVQAARKFAESDFLGFQPHMGIASGIVTVGYVGTPMRYNCSVFGKPVTIASRCADMKVDVPNYASIMCPAKVWRNYSFREIFKPVETPSANFTIHETPINWEEMPAAIVEMKNVGSVEVTSIVNMELSGYTFDPDEPGLADRSLITKAEAQEDLKVLRSQGKYKPIREYQNDR
ncbi:MAG: adenylate/guanylate cyclase domain-containing protein [Candidatus Brocadiaceae bacterium]|nr:adenylate/guanylate cyclase domain-containing protein [Candidatus Brocadiaceae bacterium]